MRRLLVFTMTLCLAVSGCMTAYRNTVFQTSTIDALLAGVYDGDMSCRDLLKHGDFGIGTFDHLDGEMVLLDGRLYQVKADGRIYRPEPSLKTPFATVCRFEADERMALLSGSTFESIKEVIDTHAPNRNLFYAVKITGTFKRMKTRSVPAQQKPYPPLKEVTRNQPEFDMCDTAGTIVGFRCPAYVKGINVPGYHLHYISNDHTRGGHVLSFEIKQATGEIDELNRYFLALPADTGAFGETDLSQDRSSDLKKVEQGHID